MVGKALEGATAALEASEIRVAMLVRALRLKTWISRRIQRLDRKWMVSLVVIQMGWVISRRLDLSQNCPTSTMMIP